MSELLKSNFKMKANVSGQPIVSSPQSEFEKKARESIGGSMVFVERSKLIWDGK